MKIVLVNGVSFPKYNLGGTAYTCYELAIALSEIGNEVEVITFNKSDNYYINKTELLVDNKVEFKFIGFFTVIFLTGLNLYSL